MPLIPGTRLGPYEIGAPIGSGGMGHLYRARDTRLDRTVAIKIVKEQFTERFEREYKAISALNHPRICTLHDIGSHEGAGYLVMEFVDGRPLKGPLPLADALRTAIQIADALEAAHTKEIVHRDLKPANILTTNSGIKLLDFGLAAFARTGVRATDVTMTTPLTIEGQIVGTLQYMSPEQLEGKEADARSDIFSFGVVLYELLTGKRAFEGSSPASLIAAILKEEPPPLTPVLVGTPALDHTLRKCLAKDPARRWQTATDLRDELGWIAGNAPGRGVPARTVAVDRRCCGRSRVRRIRGMGPAWQDRISPGQSSPVPAFPSGRGMAGTRGHPADVGDIARGGKIATVASDARFDPKSRALYASVAELSTQQSKDLFRSDTQVVFAPGRAGTSVGHLIFGRGGTLLTQRFDIGPLAVVGDPEPLAEGISFFRPTAWSEFDASADGVLIFTAASPKAQLTWVDRSGYPVGTVGGLHNYWGGLRISPDGRKIAADVGDLANGGTDIWVYDTVRALSERVTFEPGVEALPVWSPDGKRLVFASAQSGPPQLRMKFLNDHGSGEAFAPSEFQIPLDWSPDGRWIVFQTTGGEINASIWLASVSDRKILPLVQSSFDSSTPALSPDGRFLAFSGNETGRSEIYIQRFESGDTPKMAGDRRRVSREGGSMPRWRRDGKELFFVAPDGRIFAASISGNKDLEFGTPSPLFRLPAASRMGTTSVFTYEVGLDGQKFLLANRDATSAPLNVLVNWRPR